MNLDQYRGKKCLIFKLEDEGVVEDVVRRKNQSNQMTMRFVVKRPDGISAEYEPHEIQIDLTSVVSNEQVDLEDKL